jgi:spermidine synthase
VHIAIALSGIAALGAEVVWTRQLSLVFGATVYAFSIILAVFLAGLGIGSSGGAYLARKSKQPALAMAICQIAVTAAIAWASWNIAYSLPYWKIDPALSADPWQAFRIDFIRCLWAIFPAALLWGASFPLALAALASHGRDPGRLIGGLYAANTVGAILGALAFSTFVVPLGGSQQAGRFLVAASAVSSLIMLALSRSRLIRAAGWTAAIAIAIVVVWNIPPLPGLLVAYGREFSLWSKMPPAVRYVGEGMNSSVAITEWPSGVRNFHVSGKIEASSAARDMRLERMLGHLPALLHPNPKSVLVVGFGAGVTAGSFVLHPGVERIVICEIEPLIPKVVSEYFKGENYDVLNDPRVEIVYDDARHYVLTAREKFDVITSDPIHPWVKGAASLFSTEYFESIKQHLNPGGVVSQWVPLYDSTEDVVKSEIATFLKTFPNGTIWNSDLMGNGYDTVLIGQDANAGIDLDALDARLGRPDHQAVVRSLGEVKFSPPLSLLTTYSGSAADMRAWLADAYINSDRNLRLQYLAGLVMNLSEADRIFRAISRNWTFPERLFTGSPVMREGLRQALIEQLAPSR